MIKEVKSYSLVCDNCGETYRHKWTNYALWFDESAPLEYASEEGWIECEGKHYCPECWRKRISISMINPFAFGVFKPDPNNRIRELAKAGALIAAEIDRLLNKEREVSDE